MLLCACYNTWLGMNQTYCFEASFVTFNPDRKGLFTKQSLQEL